jgi:hypothetical protein
MINMSEFKGKTEEAIKGLEKNDASLSQRLDKFEKKLEKIDYKTWIILIAVLLTLIKGQDVARQLIDKYIAFGR